MEFFTDVQHLKNISQQPCNFYDFVNEIDDQLWTTVRFDISRGLPPIPSLLSDNQKWILNFHVHISSRTCMFTTQDCIYALLWLKMIKALGWVCAKYCQPHKPIVNPFDSIPWIIWAYCIFLSLNHIIPKNPSLKEKQSSLPFSWMVEFKSKLSFVVVLGVVS